MQRTTSLFYSRYEEQNQSRKSAKATPGPHLSFKLLKQNAKRSTSSRAVREPIQRLLMNSDLFIYPHLLVFLHNLQRHRLRRRRRNPRRPVRRQSLHHRRCLHRLHRRLRQQLHHLQ
ncbi:Uncharacterized protein TCM_007419 [Theobroma cacao]|uniref:Uncharacterized protein n=1 Tax=Theobroma cacao TaxID=3641 RepID=A0A061E296_THECC|nr:Uncharacterized protein TCM_007419 [Theobroma cacao]